MLNVAGGFGTIHGATNDPNTGAGALTFLDMSTYEFQVLCLLHGDSNCDGIVDLCDLALVPANCLETFLKG